MATGNDIVQYAEKFVGVPYVWGGISTRGFDCSGLVKFVFGHFKISLPRVASEQQKTGVNVNLKDIQPGDLVFFGDPAHHVGIYVGNGNMIDAPYTGARVRIEPMGTPTNVRREVAAGSIKGWTTPFTETYSGLSAIGHAFEWPFQQGGVDEIRNSTRVLEVILGIGLIGWGAYFLSKNATMAKIPGVNQVGTIPARVTGIVKAGAEEGSYLRPRERVHMGGGVAATITRRGRREKATFGPIPGWQPSTVIVRER